MPMKKLTINLADEMESDVSAFVRAGFFRSERDVLSAALIEFLRRHRPDLEERYQLQDVAWASRVAEDTAKGSLH
jgi:Arc/MetJ-type ribon-helix-helix transcriptional regulator